MKHKLLACLLGAFMIAPAMAQEKKNSISMFGNYTSMGNTETGMVYGHLGHLMSDKLEVGVSLMQIFGSFSSTGYGVDAQYYFSPVGKAGAINPYLKGDVFFINGSGVTSTQTGVSVGVALAASETSEYFAEYGFLNQSSSGRSQSGSQLNVGIKIRF